MKYMVGLFSNTSRHCSSLLRSSSVNCSCSVTSIPVPTNFRKTKVIRKSFIHERMRAAWNSVPGVRRNHIESSLQLYFERGVLLSSLGFDSG